jgi:uncharacterized damage-inducible protein DinB
MARFDGGAEQSPVIADSATFTADAAAWATVRAEADQRITGWAASITDTDRTGDIAWFSGSLNADVSRPKWECITHFFNHQTHHRGQVHAMLTAAGAKPGATDLVFMPKD